MEIAELSKASVPGKSGGGDEKKQNGTKGSKQGPRKRVSQACDKCRSRKDKCDGQKPSCSTCIANSRICSYDANVKKRGLPEGYVRGLEKFWGLAIRDVEAVEDHMLGALGGNEDSNESPLSIWNDENVSEELVETWRKSTLSRELERLLSSHEPTMEPKRKRIGSDLQASKRIEGTSFSSSSVGPKETIQGGSDFATNRWPDFGENSKMPHELQRQPNSSHSNQVPSPLLIKDVESILSPANAHLAISTGTPATTVNIPELPSETWHLIDVYFSYTHSWLPIIEKHDLLRTSYQYSRSRGTSSAMSGSDAALWAAIAYAKFQHRAINNIPRALGPVGEMVWTAERMCAQARSLIPNEEGTLELGHVQALLILTLANVGLGYYSRAWSLIGQAVRIALDLRLDQPPDLAINPSGAKTRGKHVILGCFALDTLIAARLNRKPHLRAHDIDQIGLVEEDGLEEWDPWTDCLSVRRNKFVECRGPSAILSTFNRCIEVLKILNEATCLPAENGGQYLLEKLHIWSNSQASPLYFDSSTISSEVSNLLPHQIHLHHVYFTTLATSQLRLHVTSGSNIDLEPCTRSARHIVELLKQHSQAFGLLIVPPTYDWFVNQAYDIVHSVNTSMENTNIMLNDWKRNLDHCLDDLESAWPIFESLKSTVAYISSSQSARGDNQVASQLLGIMDRSETQMSRPTPQSMTSYDAVGSYCPQMFKSQADNTQRARGVGQPGTGPSKTSHRSSFSQSSGQGLPQNPLSIYENAHVTFGGLDRRLDKAAAAKAALRHPPGVQPTIDLTQPTNPQLHRSLTMSSADVEFDPVFNELMRLDATEWTGNWDQSLMNLGFTNTGNMNQDFYAFCQEPDPLHQNNVFQQLVANSNAENTDFFDGSSFGMSSGMGMNAFDELGMGDENEGIEAGQILQALSAAEDQRSLLENG